MDGGRHARHLGILTCMRWFAITSLQQIRSYQHMSGRIGFPVRAEIVHVPERELIDDGKSPSGSGGDVAVKKRPVR